MTTPLPTVQIWDATGTNALGVLEGYSSIDITDVFCDAGVCRLTFPASVNGSQHLDVDTDWQIAVIMPGVANPMWFVSDDDETTWVTADPATEPITLTCRSLHALLEETLVFPSGGAGTLPAEWAFTTATPGKVVKDLWDAAQVRNMLQNVTLAGDATVDADGVAWGSTVTVTYKAGTTLAQVAKGLYEAGLLEFRWNGREFEIYKDSGGLDRNVDLTFRPGWDVLSAPLIRSRRDLATGVLVEGTGSDTEWRTQSLTDMRFREVYVSETNAPSSALADIGDLFLTAHSLTSVQITHELTDADATWRPWVDFRPGDRVLTSAFGWRGPWID